MGLVIEFLKRAPAKVIAVDVAFPEHDHVLKYVFDDPTDEWSGNASDNNLVENTRKAGNVVLLADAVYEGIDNAKVKDKNAATWRGSAFHAGALAEPRPLVLAPFQSLTDAAAALGHNFLVRDGDDIARRMSPFIVSDGKELPSLGVAAALLAGGFKPQDVGMDGRQLHIGDRRIPLVSRRVDGHDQWSMLINYRAPSGIVNAAGRLERPYKSYEFRNVFVSEQLILGGQAPVIDPSVFKDKIVFIGLTASGLLDVFDTPVSSDVSGAMPGIQLHASMVDSILANRFITPPSTKTRVASVCIIALGIGLLSAFLPFTRALAASLVILGGWTW